MWRPGWVSRPSHRKVVITHDTRLPAPIHDHERITEALTRIKRARGFLEAATLSEDWIREMGKRALVLEAHHTTHIEGTQLTLDQAERLMAGESVPEADPDDVRELLNYRRAFDFVSEYL